MYHRVVLLGRPASGKGTQSSMLSRRLDLVIEANGPRFIFDGYPRTVAQAEVLDAILREQSVELDCIISLEVPNRLMDYISLLCKCVLRRHVIERLSCTRCNHVVRSSAFSATWQIIRKRLSCGLKSMRGKRKLWRITTQNAASYW